MADDSSGFTFIDEKGRVFGLINIVDLLVIVLVVAVGVAGMTLVLGMGGDEEQEQERYATLELGDQPEYVAEEIQEGDQWVTEDGMVTITDTYMAASSSDGNVDVWIQAKINETTVDDGTDRLSIGERPVKLGESLEIETEQYGVTGTIVRITESTTEIPTETRDIAVVGDISQAAADRITVGDNFTVANQTWLSVEEQTRYATSDRNTDRLVLGVTAEVQTIAGTSQLGHQSVQVGESVPVRVGSDQMSGSIVAIDSLEEPGETSTKTVTMQANATEQPSAELVESGMVETTDGTEFAEVLDVEFVERETGTDEDKEVNENVEITVSMTVQEQDEGTITYRADPVLLGDEIVLQLDTGPIVEWRVTDINN